MQIMYLLTVRSQYWIWFDVITNSNTVAEIDIANTKQLTKFLCSKQFPNTFFHHNTRQELLWYKCSEYEQSNRIECNKNHFSITLRRVLMSIGIVTHDAARWMSRGKRLRRRTDYYFRTTKQNWLFFDLYSFVGFLWWLSIWRVTRL